MKVKQRRVFFCIGVVAVFIVLVSCIKTACKSTLDRVQWAEETYIVEKGDTLWGIGSMYCPENVSLREWIDEVRDLNDLYDCVIYTGDSLIILVPNN